MEMLFYENIEEFVENIMNDYDSGDIKDKNFSIIAKYNEAKEIVQELIFNGCHLKSINLHDGIVDGYYNEYIITISSIDNDYEIWCEKMKHENDEYLRDFSSKAFILDNCSSKVICNCQGSKVYEVTIDEYEEHCKTVCGYECCEYCDCCYRDNEEKNEVRTTKESYTVNGKTVSKEEFDKYDSDIKKRIKEFEDEINTFKRMLFYL